MRKVAVSAVAGVCLLASLAAGQSTPPAGKPVIQADQAEHDFGLIWSGPKVNHTFKITNTGTADLQITRVRTNCGCTVAGEHPKTLAPGAIGSFPFSLTTTGIKGPFTKTITIYANDPATPQIPGRHVI